MMRRKLEIDLGQTVTLADLQDLVRSADEAGAAASDAVVVEHDENDEVSCLSASLTGRSS